jgi:hypothetical protein
MVRRGAWDPRWFIGSMTLSLSRPSLLHPWYGGPITRFPDDQCQDKTSQKPKISMLRDNRSKTHYSN